ncbi:hypothetical protein F2Q70_00043209 [Brassica cretica]|uniref:Uncharacterized protein n=1 Tax=Brassica cretica TaxID=69181 RepID=A0A8S9KKK6_BRACR|nr:hypothetical protein F2Q70_00043209 [Brassica cretica]
MKKRSPIPFAKASDRCKGRGGACDRLEKSWIKQKELYAQGRSSLDGWKSEDLPPKANIMEHIASCRKALSQWRRQNNMNSEKVVEAGEGRGSLCE